MTYWAHSEVNGNKHELAEHIFNVAQLASYFAEPFRCNELAYWAGLWHDIGKFSPEFQKYIQNPTKYNGRVDHSSAGMVWADSHGAVLLALLIAGHHGGINTPAAIKARLEEKHEDCTVKASLAEASNSIPGITPDKSVADTIRPCLDLKDIFLTETALRFLFSCLVDADYLDTESHFSPEKTQARGNGVELRALWNSLEVSQAPYLLHKSGGVNALRNEIYNSCLNAAKEPPGFFSLTVPTGGGKTRSGMAFALSHAILHGLKRVIVVLPYTSIIEQNVDVYRSIFGHDNVLEHHSAVDFDDEEGSETNIRMRLATENWDAPIIVTTTVQFFESLFSNKTSRTRKLHNIAGSVVILDEVQALPEKYLTSIQDMLYRLVESFGCSVVLSSATQPSLGQETVAGILKGIREIVPEPNKYFNQLKRVEYELPANSEKWTWSRVADEMRASRQALAVLNTKKDALALLDALDDQDALHLSTNMCGAHRREVLKEIRRRLATDEPCHLVSTQVVEAGVDLDFPLVLRALGPLDRIVQAAGRCNREGRLEKGRVVVFVPEKGGCPPGAYKSGTDAARIMLKDAAPDELHDPSFYDRYFRTLHSAVDMDPEGIQKMRRRLNFPGVAESFKLISEDTVSVIVRYDYDEHISKMERLLKEFQYGNLRHALRKLQPYMVSRYRNKLHGYRRDGLVEEVRPDLYLWLGGYDKINGICDEYIDPENYCK